MGMLRFRPLGVSRDCRGSPTSRAVSRVASAAAEMAGDDSVEPEARTLLPVAGSAAHAARQGCCCC